MQAKQTEIAVDFNIYKNAIFDQINASKREKQIEREKKTELSAPLNNLKYDFSCFSTQTKSCNLFYVANAICLFQCISMRFWVYVSIFRFVCVWTYFISPCAVAFFESKMARSEMTAICFKFLYAFGFRKLVGWLMCLCEIELRNAFCCNIFAFYVSNDWHFDCLKFRFDSLHFGSKFEIVSIDWRDWFWFVIHCAIASLMQHIDFYLMRAFAHTHHGSRWVCDAIKKTMMVAVRSFRKWLFLPTHFRTKINRFETECHFIWLQ